MVVWDQLVEAWEARRAGNTGDAEARYAAARNSAKLRGFQYVPGAKVAQLPMKDLLARIDAIPMTSRGPNLKEADALLGLVEPPAITVTQSLKLFWGLTEDRIVGKSQDQVRRWQYPRKKAVANFVNVVGDMALKDLTQDTMLDFRDWWCEKIKREGLRSGPVKRLAFAVLI